MVRESVVQVWIQPKLENYYCYIYNLITRGYQYHDMSKATAFNTITHLVTRWPFTEQNKCYWKWVLWNWERKKWSRKQGHKQLKIDSLILHPQGPINQDIGYYVSLFETPFSFLNKQTLAQETKIRSDRHASYVIIVIYVSTFSNLIMGLISSSLKQCEEIG